MSILDRFKIENQVAVVVGASEGIGRAIALAFAEAGADVVVSSRRQAVLDKVVEEIEARGRKGLAVAGDGTNRAFLASLADAAIEKFGKLDIWVNNIGGRKDNGETALVDMTDETFDFEVDLNLRSVLAGSTAAAARMSEGGVIINVSSRGSRLRRPGLGNYAALKAAVNSMTATLALELAPKIRVNAVCPGPVPTETFMYSLNLDEEGLKALLPKFNLPLQRWGTPEDQAAAALFLASPAASWITGEAIYVTGGG